MEQRVVQNDLRKNCEIAAKRLSEGRISLIGSYPGEGAFPFMERHAHMVDDYFRESFEISLVGPDMAINRNPFAIIALGGYGRQEQCVHSDVDVLFLFQKEVPAKAESLIREILYPLWDIGLDIGHATRSMKECVGLAGQDHEILTSLLDARFICGMSPLYTEMKRMLREKVLGRRAQKIIDRFLQGNRERYEVFGESAHLLEPNLKEGRGGLRDYHTLIWIGRIQFDLGEPRDLEYHGLLSHAEYHDLMAAVAFVHQLRNGLHLMVGRKYDRLHFNNQIRIAERLGYPSDGSRHPVEAMMSDLHAAMETIRRTHFTVVLEIGKTRKWFAFRKSPPRRPLTDGLEIRRSMLAFAATERIPRQPAMLLHIFRDSAVLRLPISADAHRLVREFGFLIERIPTAEIREVMEILLATPATDTMDALSEMHGAGLLGRIIPEFSDVADQIEFGDYHIRPVDRHLIRTVRYLNRFAERRAKEASPLAFQLYGEIEDATPMLWAALFHDIGKGEPDADHSEVGADIARKRLSALGYTGETVDTTAFLVREHLLLKRISSRRDVEAPETLQECLSRVGTPQRLRMLYLLTLADLLATGPNAWNEWIDTLLRQLFFRLIDILEMNGSEPPLSEVRRGIRMAMAGRLSVSELESANRLLEVMPNRYLKTFPPEEVVRHVRLFFHMADTDFAWRIDQPEASEGIRVVTVCARDMPGLLSKIAGIFYLNGIDIHDARVYTWRNHVAYIIFRVKPPPDPLFEAERWKRAEGELRDALARRVDLAEAIGPPDGECPPGLVENGPVPPDKVVFDNESSESCTIIEVFTTDTPGLLYRITDVLYRGQLDITSARISTSARQAVDVFYVKDFDAGKVVSEERLRTLERAILDVLPGKNCAEKVRTNTGKKPVPC